jgi:hypothetical protein
MISCGASARTGLISLLHSDVYLKPLAVCEKETYSSRRPARRYKLEQPTSNQLVPLCGPIHEEAVTDLRQEVQPRKQEDRTNHDYGGDGAGYLGASASSSIQPGPCFCQLGPLTVPCAHWSAVPSLRVIDPKMGIEPVATMQDDTRLAAPITSAGHHVNISQDFRAHPALPIRGSARLHTHTYSHSPSQQRWSRPYLPRHRRRL